MSDLIKELADVLYKLDNLYYETKSEEKKEKIKIHFFNLSEHLEKAIRSQFDENDTLYLGATRQLKKAGSQLDKLKDDLEKITNIFKLLTDLTLQLDILLTKSSR